MKEELFYDCRWSSDCDTKFIDDFNSVQDQVFRGVHTRELFRHQYIDNPYGASVLVVVYLNEKPIAARSMWRNDIQGKEAYQPGRTCVLAECRGRGVFTEMTQRALAIIPKDAIIYNFPNPNSYPGYIKMGWVGIGDYYIRLFCSAKQYDQEHPLAMDETYFNWWVKGRPSLRYIKRGCSYYLVNKYPRPLCYTVLSKVSKEIAMTCKKAPWYAIIWYASKQITFYNKNIPPRRPVVRHQAIEAVPMWKIDAI